MKFLLVALIGTIFLILPAIALATTDFEYERTGEQIMEQMMGVQHEQADQNITETMGEDFLKQMHIAMGKMAEKNVSGQTNFGMMPMMGIGAGGGGFNMMGGSYGMMGGNFGLYVVLAWVTWILVTIALILGIVWLWKQIQKK